MAIRFKYQWSIDIHFGLMVDPKPKQQKDYSSNPFFSRNDETVSLFHSL